MKDEAKHEHHKKNNDASTNDTSRAETVTDAIAKQPTDNNADTQAAPAVEKTNETNPFADRAVGQAQAEAPTPNPFEGSANQAQATQTAYTCNAGCGSWSEPATEYSAADGASLLYDDDAEWPHANYGNGATGQTRVRILTVYVAGWLSL